MNAKEFKRHCARGKVVRPSGLREMQAKKGGHFMGMVHLGDNRYRTKNRAEHRKKLARRS